MLTDPAALPADRLAVLAVGQSATMSRRVLIFAAADILAIGYAVGVYAALLVVPGAVTWAKGHRLIFLVGLVMAGVVWLVASMRLARPDSWWARRFYIGVKLDRARARYGAERAHGGETL
jgi:malonyl CoA-acyl carrier protein transacylase